MKKTTAIITAAGIVAVAVVLSAVLWQRPPVVATYRVPRQAIQNKVFSTGQVRPTERQVVMSTDVGAPIVGYPVTVSARVHPGDRLLDTQNQPQKHALEAANQALSAAQSAVRMSPGNPAAMLSLAQARSQQAQAQAAFDSTVIKARFEGTVMAENPDGIDPNGNAAPLLEIASMAKMVVLELSQVDAVHVRPGMSGTVTSEAYPNQSWAATIQTVAPYAAVSGTSGANQVEVTLKPHGRFPIPLGYDVNVNILTRTDQAVPVVPYAALVQSGDVYQVFVVRGGRVHAVPITVGATANAVVEVVRGLHAGDTVVLNPPTSLQNAERVRAT